MIGIDTHVLLRLLLDDEPSQSARARALLQGLADRGETAFVASGVLLEAVWVLRRRDRVPKAEVLDILRDLLGASEFVVGDRDAVAVAAKAWASGAGDFAEYLFAAQAKAAGAPSFATFDRAVLGEPGFVAP